METNPNEERTCCVCQSKLLGRSDKVFCDVSCKNKYHGALRRQNKSVSSETIKKLNRNYQILCYLLGEDADSYIISKLELVRLGFQFGIISGIEHHRFGIKCQVYEFSFYFKKNGVVAVSREKKQSLIAPYVYRRWKRIYASKEAIPPNLI